MALASAAARGRCEITIAVVVSHLRATLLGGARPSASSSRFTSSKLSYLASIAPLPA